MAHPAHPGTTGLEHKYTKCKSEKIVQPRVAEIKTKPSPWFHIVLLAAQDFQTFHFASLLQIFHFWMTHVTISKNYGTYLKYLKEMSILFFYLVSSKLIVSGCSNFLRQRNIDEINFWNISQLPFFPLKQPALEMFYDFHFTHDHVKSL